MKRILRVLLAMTLALGVMAGTAAADNLWYNGDFNGSGTGQYNRHIYLAGTFPAFMQSDSYVYDDFVVPAGGWTVNSVWSNNLFASGVVVSAATWEIRSSVLAGNGGTLVQSGSGTPTVSATGGSYNNGFDEYTEYQVLFNVSPVNLAPGRYWLNVTPTTIIDNYGKIFISYTSGLNAVGEPAGDNGNSFIDSYEHSMGGQDTHWPFVAYSTDFSMGIDGVGSPVPLPASLPLLGSGLLGLLGWGYRRRK